MESMMRYAKKYYFWPVCFIAMGLALFFWNIATGDLDKKFTANESNFTQSKSSVDNIPSNPPNEKAVKAVQRKKIALNQNVYNAWQLLYDKQNEGNQWPEITINNRPVDFNAERISTDAGEQYRYRIVEEFKKLVDTVHPVSERDKNGVAIDDEIGRAAANMDSTTPDAASTAAAETEPTDTAVKKELVIWPEKDIDDLIGAHFSWDRIPSTLKIRVAQEDFWIFKSLLDAINTLNEGVDNRTNASLKEIRSILITGDAIEKFHDRQENGFFDEKSFGKTGTAGDEEAAPEEVGATPAESGSGEGGTLTKEFRELYDMRYVDKNCKGLSAEQYNASIDVQTAGVNYSKTRNVPVYLSLVIKQNRLSDLMAALTNAEKPLDIKLTLVNPGQGWKPTFDFSAIEDADENSEDAAMAPESGSSGGRGRAAKSGSRGRGSSRNQDNGRSGGSQDSSKLGSDEIVVDIYGIISLFNPPPQELFPDLTSGAEDGENSEENGENETEDADAAATDADADAKSEEE